jgi:glutamate-1-semialdehyde 2,1-aminomutase
MFSKNGTDATTQALMVARAATGRTKVLMAHGAYHGSDPWCTPSTAGTTPNERADLIEFTYNDLASAEAAAARAEGDVAAIIVTPFKHDAFEDQELVEPAFARGVRALADRIGAALVIDDVRAGFRIDLRGSWEPYGVWPDLTAWSKAMANGYAIAAVTGTDALREPAQTLYTTGSFWFSAVAMAAAKATIETLRDEDGIAAMERAGHLLRDGLRDQAKAHGFTVNQTGPVTIPWLSFEGDTNLEKALYWSDACLRHGVYIHPWHNWFMSAAHTEDDVAAALQGTDAAFAETGTHFGDS